MANGSEVKKGLSPLAWVAIGCGVLAIVAVVGVIGAIGFIGKKVKDVADEVSVGFQENPARATAEMIVKLNPELDLVESDDDAGTITFRNNKTGEQATLNFEDIAEGKFSVTTDEGEYSMDASAAGDSGSVTFSGPDGEARFGASADTSDVPDWVLLYPTVEETQGAFHTTSGGKITGVVTQKTRHSAEEVIAYYKSTLVEQGFTVEGETSVSTQDGKIGGIQGQDTASGRSLNIGALEQGGETQVSINYNGNAED